jgi:hypothetical protein
VYRTCSAAGRAVGDGEADGTTAPVDGLAVAVRVLERVGLTVPEADEEAVTEAVTDGVTVGVDDGAVITGAWATTLCTVMPK